MGEMTMAAAAKVLGCSEDTIIRARDGGQITVTKVGRRYLVDPEVIGPELARAGRRVSFDALATGVADQRAVVDAQARHIATLEREVADLRQQNEWLRALADNFGEAIADGRLRREVTEPQPVPRSGPGVHLEARPARRHRQPVGPGATG